MYTINGHELYHHGILGMKWGKRQGPPYPLSPGEHSAAERKAGYKKSIGGGRNEEAYDRNRRKIEKKQNKIAKKYDKEISKAERDRDKIMSARERNRQRIEAKYDKKLKKEEFNRDSFEPIKEGLKDKKGRDILTKDDVSKMQKVFSDRINKLQAKKDAKLKDFDEGSKYVRGGEQKYIDIIKNYKDAKISAVENKLYKKDPKYKQAIAEYVNQVGLNMFLSGGSAMTKLGYASDIANPNKRRLYTVDPNYAQKKHDKKYGKSSLEINKSDSSVTKKVKNDYNSMNDEEFKSKYKVSKKVYSNRVDKYGDPYMSSPLARYAKKKNSRR